MKYREKKSSKTEYKQKEIHEKKPIACMLTPYKEDHGGSSGGGAKKAQQWRRATKPARRRLAETEESPDAI
jgi:hypothetical protein